MDEKILATHGAGGQRDVASGLGKPCDEFNLSTAIKRYGKNNFRW